MSSVKQVGKYTIEQLIKLSPVVKYNISGTEVSYFQKTISEREYFQNDFDGDKIIIRELLERSGPNDCVWDIGANVGHYSCAIDAHPPSVVAFEPYPDNINRFVENRRLNELHTPIFTLALADGTGCETFTVPVPGVRAAQGKLSGSNEQQSGDTIGVPTVAGDSIITDGGVEKPTVLKIDVEGAAPRVINGLQDSLQSVHTIYVEPHNNANEVRSLLSDHGFSEARNDLKGILFTKG